MSVPDPRIVPVRCPSIFPALLAVLFLALPGCDLVPAAVPDDLTIGEVQGSGDRSPWVGQEVEVEGIVTARFEGLQGLFVQSPLGEEDGDPATSDGIFLRWMGDSPPQADVGERVGVLGSVVELGRDAPTLTAIEIRELTSLGADPEAMPEPTAVAAAPSTVEVWERLEGMRIRVEVPLTVTGNGSLQRFGELITSFDGRLFQPTELHPPGLEAATLGIRNSANRLVLDDGSQEEWPARIPYLEDWPDHEAPLRTGSALGPVTGVVDVRRGGYLLLPTEEVEVQVQASRTEPPEVEGDLRVVVLNVENLFNGDGRGGGFPTARGAQTPELYALQQAKLVATLQALEADVAALAEVENDGAGPETAIVQFAEALNAAGPARDWRAVEVSEGPGSDVIRVGLLYRTGRVTPVGAPVFPTDPIFSWGSRPPLGQAFARVDGEGEPWLVVSNHLKSKGGCPEPGHPHALPGDRDQGDGQACWNARRVQAASALADWIDGDPAGIGVDNVLIVGDLNSYGREDPIRILEGRGWVDAFAEVGHTLPYSYVFQGESGRLDHVLIRDSRRHRLRGAAIWHSNADEFTGFGYEYDPSPAVWRSSDHDVLLVGVDP